MKPLEILIEELIDRQIADGNLQKIGDNDDKDRQKID